MIESHLGQSVIVDVDPPTAAQVVEAKEGAQHIHPLSASTLKPSEAVRKTGEVWPPERVGVALIRGYEAEGFRPRTPGEQAAIKDHLRRAHAKGALPHPSEQATE